MRNESTLEKRSYKSDFSHKKTNVLQTVSERLTCACRAAVCVGGVCLAREEGEKEGVAYTVGVATLQSNIRPQFSLLLLHRW